MITSSSIGYGDLTPKSPYQMYFMIGSIPILIISFGLYFGNIIGLFNEALSLIYEQVVHSVQSLLNQGTWGGEQYARLLSFIQESKGRSSAQQELNQQWGGNWISIAGRHHQSHAPVFSQVLDKIQSKQHRLLVSSKLKKQYYPQGWMILTKGDSSEYIYLIEEGQVQCETNTLKKGDIFNKNGFFSKEKSAQTYITKTFCTLWSMKIKYLQTIGQKSSNLQINLNKKFSQVCGQ